MPVPPAVRNLPDDEKRSLSEKLREQRLETVVAEVERIALRLFDQQGFANVTVEDIASEAGISVRTFYRYFPAKEDVLQVRLRREARGLRAALEERPPDESPVRSLRVAFEQVAALEDPVHVGRWIRVIAGTPSVLAGVMGAIQLISNAAIRDFFASRTPERPRTRWLRGSGLPRPGRAHPRRATPAGISRAGALDRENCPTVSGTLEPGIGASAPTAIDKPSAGNGRRKRTSPAPPSTTCKQLDENRKESHDPCR